MAHELLPEMGAPMIVFADGRRVWMFPDGTVLPVVSGGDGPEGGSGGGDGSSGGDGGDDGGAGSGDDNGSGGDDSDSDDDKDVDGLKSALAKERADRKARDSDLKKLRKEHDDLKKKTMSADEKLLADAKDSAKAEARAEMAPRLLAAEVRAAAAGRLTDEQRSTLLDGLDATKFLTDDGDVDTEKVSKLIDGLAPKDGTSGKKKTDIGQGRQGGTPKPTVSSGKELYATLRGGSKKSND